MKRLKLFYNPFSGDKQFKNYLDDCIATFQAAGYETHITRSTRPGDIEAGVEKAGKEKYDAFVISGGDGSINLLLNAMMDKEVHIPLGIIPSGTANDFATFLKLPKKPEDAAKVIARGNVIEADVGTANEKFFINVCSAGLLSNISQAVDVNIKGVLGKLAYYLKGLEQLPSFVPIPVSIATKDVTVEEEIFLFIALNSGGTGGFDKLVPEASISDGKLELLAFKACSVMELAGVFVNVVKGNLLNDPHVIHMQSDYFHIRLLDDQREFTKSDLDGEAGPDLPLEIGVAPKAVKLFV